MKRISVCLSGFNQSLLFSRALFWLAKQNLPKDDWELIVVDDCSSEDWPSLFEPYQDQIDIRYFRLEHDLGWRGGTIGWNKAFSEAEGEILMETNPHLLLPTDAVKILYLAHKTDFAKKVDGRLWVSLRGYTIARDSMEHFEEIDWRSDLENVRKLPNFSNPWTMLWENEPNHFYGSHLCCSYPRTLWFDEIAEEGHREVKNQFGPGFPEFCDYGHCDCWFAGRRQQLGITSVNIDMKQCSFKHQDHYSNFELASRFKVRSWLNDKGHTQITSKWWGEEWVPVNPNGLWPAPPVPWESYIPGSKKLPGLRPEFAYYYDPKWAKENAPWLVEELE